MQCQIWKKCCHHYYGFNVLYGTQALSAMVLKVCINGKIFFEVFLYVKLDGVVLNDKHVQNNSLFYYREKYSGALHFTWNSSWLIQAQYGF